MKIVNENIIKTDCEVIIHGCNAQGAFGAGVAKAIGRKWPKCKQSYEETIATLKKRYPDNYAEKLIGLSIWYDIFDENSKIKRIENLITQKEYGREPQRVYANIDAIDQGIRDILQFNRHVKKFAVPKIGCGLGGLPWSEVQKVLLDIERDCKVEFVVYEI